MGRVAMPAAEGLISDSQIETRLIIVNYDNQKAYLANLGGAKRIVDSAA